ncbi:xylulokinase [Gemmiger sp.]|uniref:xylulokinase n=1 Tax=Gemmiger sp. TaxID=2049027 RepID=UPI003F113BCC
MSTTPESKKCALGLEFGSTRIKAVLIGPDFAPLAQGDFAWENQLDHGIWTYPQQEILHGLQAAYAALAADVQGKFGLPLTTVGCIGISAMMHGYLAFDRAGNLLVPFRTWRNTVTGPAAEELTALLGFNIPQRWSVAHLDQAILNGEEHLARLDFFTTLAGYIHWQLTGRKVVGVGDAAGMFPIDPAAMDYDAAMLEQFDALAASRGFGRRLKELLPAVLPAGADAGALTPAGARLLDPTGVLQPGIPFCPPEGDAGTGMAATNSVAPRTGNVSAGTSIFAMVVLERPLSRVYPEIDLVTTPAGDPVAMVHCNNCTSDLNAWVALLGQFAALCGAPVSTGALFTRLFEESLKGDTDCGGVVPVNYYSGEGVTHLDAGRPLLVRGPESRFTLANLMRGSIYSAMATLKLGLDILNREQVAVDRLMGHGGLFKTPGVAQRYLAAAANAPVTCMSTAGEGGPYGMALLAAYRLAAMEGCTAPLDQWLEQAVFAGAPGSTIAPDAADVAGFEAFMKRYQGALAAERAAVEHF